MCLIHLCGSKYMWDIQSHSFVHMSDLCNLIHLCTCMCTNTSDIYLDPRKWMRHIMLCLISAMSFICARVCICIQYVFVYIHVKRMYMYTSMWIHPWGMDIYRFISSGYIYMYTCMYLYISMRKEYIYTLRCEYIHEAWIYI